MRKEDCNGMRRSGGGEEYRRLVFDRILTRRLGLLTPPQPCSPHPYSPQLRNTKSHIKMTYKEGEGWGPLEFVNEPYIRLHIGATSLHYGQSCFEGLKAFAHSDNSVHIFRPDENAKRLQSSCERTMMPVVPHDTFIEACNAVVKDNMAYVPPYGSNGALYLRPLMFGSGPRIGLQPADEYTFLILAIPVGDYYKGGLSPTSALVIEDYDRAAPRGVGNVKVAGNYVADLLPNMESKKKGFPIGLYLGELEPGSLHNTIRFETLTPPLPPQTLLRSRKSRNSPHQTSSASTTLTISTSPPHPLPCSPP